VIGSVRGTVLEVSPTGEVLVEVGGVGYRLLVPLPALATLEAGAPAFLFTHLHVRDDAMVLYGFSDRDERDTFEVLIGVSGVGPKLALAILSVHSPPALRRVLVDEDLDMVARANGVGPKLAGGGGSEPPALDVQESESSAAAAQVAPVGAGADAASALLNLGFRPAEAAAAVQAAEDELGPGATLDALVRLALRKAAK